MGPTAAGLDRSILSPVTQAEFAAQVRKELQEVRDGLARAGCDLRPAQLSWKPSPSVWGVGEILDHMRKVTESYRTRLESAVAHAPQLRSPDAPYLPSAVGRWLARASGPGSNTPAPRAYWPDPEPDERIARLVVEQLDANLLLMSSAQGIDWRKTKVRVPLAPGLRLNLGDWFTVLAGHSEYHRRQIVALRERPDFPSA